jgi:hypothetical protein
MSSHMRREKLLGRAWAQALIVTYALTVLIITISASAR